MRYFPINKSTINSVTHRNKKSGYGLMMRGTGSNITSDVYTSSVAKPTEVLRNIRVSKSRLPKKYITFE